MLSTSSPRGPPPLESVPSPFSYPFNQLTPATLSDLSEILLLDPKNWGLKGVFTLPAFLGRPSSVTEGKEGPPN